MAYFEEYDPYTGERPTFGGIAEAADEYHRQGLACPWDCARCDPPWYEYEEALAAPGDDPVEVEAGDWPDLPF